MEFGVGDFFDPQIFTDGHRLLHHGIDRYFFVFHHRATERFGLVVSFSF